MKKCFLEWEMHSPWWKASVLWWSVPVTHWFDEKAWDAVPEDRIPAKSFIYIPQGPSQPFTQFVAKLQETARRQVSNTRTVDISVLQLAYAKANQDYRQALRQLAI